MASKLALVTQVVEGGGNYFSSPHINQEFISSGCCLLDCVLGGGWPLGRISNVIGNQATGKTLIAIEACANFAIKFPKGEIHYREAEAAFDQQYAQALGMPVERVDFGEADFFTVEDFFEDLTKTITNLTKRNLPGLYIVDSLDALSDRDELDREIDKGTYGATKAKKMSELFRRLVKKVEASKIHLMIISQVRDSLTTMAFAKKTTRSGGRALDFYASQIVELAHMGALTSQKNNVRRATGVSIKVKCTKNKVGLPLREAEFNIVFGLGIDRLNACIDWLKDIKRLDVLGTDDKECKKYVEQIDSMSDSDYWNTVQDIEGKVSELWLNIELGFLPKRKKYTVTPSAASTVELSSIKDQDSSSQNSTD